MVPYHDGCNEEFQGKTRRSIELVLLDASQGADRRLLLRVDTSCFQGGHGG